MQIQRTLIPHNRPTIDRSDRVRVCEALGSNILINGRQLQQFEGVIAESLGVESDCVACVSSGTAAVYLSLRALGLQGKNILLPAYTCSSLLHAVTLSGNNPIYSDLIENHLVVSSQRLVDKDVDAAIVPHIFGVPADHDFFSNGKPVIEDCAHAIGGRYHGNPCGLNGAVGIFSFYATKLMTSNGGGGAIVSRDPAFIREVKAIMDYDGVLDGRQKFNFYMTESQAAMGISQLEKLPGFIRRRAEIFGSYVERGLPLMGPADNEGQAGQSCVVRYRAVLRCPEKISPKRMISYLEKVGVESIIPITTDELLCKNPDVVGSSVKISETTISIPLYPSLSDRSVSYISDQLLELLDGGG